MGNYSLGKLIYELSVDGEGKFTTSLKEAENQVKQFTESCKKTGENLTKFVTLPILALGAASLKLASDAEVGARKFATAFKGAELEAADAVRVLTEQYKLSATQSKQLLAFTGDLLKGFGATSSQALSTSLSVQKLAASLAAYNGIPVAQASEAITKALLGETEGLKMLGVAINQDMVMEELAKTGRDKLTGTSLKLAQSEAILAIAYKQSGDAVSSFADNTDTATAKTQQLLGQLQDAAVSLGEQLLPAFKAVVDIIIGAVKWFTGLDDTTKNVILVLAGLAAAAGPVISAIGGITTAVSFLMANPIVAAIAGAVAGIALLVTGLSMLQNELKKTINPYTELVDKQQESIKATNTLFDQYREYSNASKDAAGAQENLRDVQAQLIAKYPQLGDYIDEQTGLLKLNEEQIRNIQIAEQERLKVTLNSQIKVTEGLIANLRTQLQAYINLPDWQKSIMGIIPGQNTGVLAQLDALKNQTSALNEQRRTLAAVNTELDKLYHPNRYQSPPTTAPTRVPAAGGPMSAETVEYQKQLQQQQLDSYKDYQMSEAEVRQEMIEAETAGLAERARAYEEFINTATSFMGDFFGNVGEALVEGGDAWAEFGKSVVMSIAQIIDALGNKALVESAANLGYALAAASNPFTAWLAPGFFAAAAQWGGVGILAKLTAGIVRGLAGKIQLADGGLLQPTIGGVPFIGAEAGHPEAVLPLTDDIFRRLGQGIVAANQGTFVQGGGQVVPVILQNILDGKVMTEVVVGFINGGSFTLNKGAVR